MERRIVLASDSPSFYESVERWFNPGDFLEDVPFSRAKHPLQIARKLSIEVSNRHAFKGELREIFEEGKHSPTPALKFLPPGEDALANTKKTLALLLTWGSEIDSDLKGRREKKDWLVAPVFPLANLKGQFVHGTTIEMPDAVRSGGVAKFFLVPSYPADGNDYYVDFKRICYVSIPHLEPRSRRWKFHRAAMNSLYHQLIWFFTRKKIFFEPVGCPTCGNAIDLNVVFEGQHTPPDDPYER